MLSRLVAIAALSSTTNTEIVHVGAGRDLFDFPTNRALGLNRDKFLASSQTGRQSMARISKLPVERHDGKASLIPKHVIVVRVASFAFRFESVERLRECIEYYEKKRVLAVASRLGLWPQNSEKIGENSEDGK